MQRTTDFHNETAESRLQQAVGVMDDATALHTAVHVLTAYTPAGNAPIGGSLCTGESSPPRLLGWFDDLDQGERKRQKVQILEHRLPGRKGDGVASAMRLSWVLPG
jgi:hypothetical protein